MMLIRANILFSVSCVNKLSDILQHVIPKVQSVTVLSLLFNINYFTLLHFQKCFITFFGCWKNLLLYLNYM